jgi:hypothetical protein
MKDYFLQELNDAVQEMAPAVMLEQGPNIHCFMLELERKVAREHPFMYAEHLALRWWEMTHRESNT